MKEAELKRIAAEAAKGMAFIVPFANVLVKLRKAEQGLHGVSLQHSEVKVILEGLRLLKEPREPR